MASCLFRSLRPLRTLTALLLGASLALMLLLAPAALGQTVTGVSPTAGPAAGGNAVAITGSGFTGATSVAFGAAHLGSGSFTVVDDGDITATAPAGTPGSTVDVTVTAGGQTSPTSSADQYTYVAAPTVSGVTPAAGPVAGGTTVTITGTNLSGATGVSFGMTPGTITSVSATQIIATSPQVATPGDVDVTVTTADGGTSAANPPDDQFSYDAVPQVGSVSPPTGAVAGGTVVTISGSGFTGVSAVLFGSAQATNVSVSGGQITATSPAGSGTVGVTVTTPGGTSTVTGSGQEFTYVPPPAVTGVSPSAGPIAGATSVTITGTGFFGTTGVKFGSSSVPTNQFTVDSDSQITATSPAGSSGTVHVTVTIPTYGTSSTSNADEFTYDPIPVVSGVSPSAGPDTGGTAITLTGSGFTGASVVDVGGSSVPFTVVTDKKITLTTPGGTDGPADVTVTTPGGTSATSSSDQFTFVPAPTVSGVTPNAGLLAGGTSVKITGTNLSGATGVSFGQTPATIVSDTATQITVTSPQVAAPVTDDITVTTAGGTSATSTADQFSYDAVPTVTGVNPGAGPLAGGTGVTITGTGFTGATAVDFGSAPAQILTVTSNAITTTSPGGSAGPVVVTVTTPGGTSSSTMASTREFTYTSGPTITSLSPSAGPVAGGTAVTIAGTNLGSAQSVKFGSLTAVITADSSTSITATVPPASAAGTATVVVKTPGGSSPTTGSGFVFSYDALPTVTSVSPGSGPDAGGTTVTVNGTGFVDGGTTAAFGSTPGTDVKVVSSKQLTVSSPVHSDGAFDVTVTTPGGTSGTSAADQFAFTPPLTPDIAKLSPSLGPIEGGTSVTIIGSKFTGARAVQFGSKPASSFRVNSDSQIVAVSPAEGAGTVEVTVTTTAGGSSQDVSAGHFSYEPAPALALRSAGPLAQHRVTLNATVDPNGLAVTSCEFQWGRTRHYGHAAACSPQLGASVSPQAVKATLSGLKPATRYHYRLVSTNTSGTSDGPDETFSTEQLPPVGTPSVGLLLERVMRPAGTIGKLLGVQGITGARVGETIVVRCVRACARPLSLRIKLHNVRMMHNRIAVSGGFLLSAATRIEIDISAAGRLSRYARYAFTPAGPNVAVHLTSSGCLSARRKVVRCT
jgi:hypothetical protein